MKIILTLFLPRLTKYVEGVLAALLITAIAQAALAQQLSRYPVVDSGYEGESLVTETVAWIDNERVLFTGYGPLSAPRPPDRYDNKALYMWNVRSGEIKKYAALGRSSGFCLASGVIRYWFERQGSLVKRFGRLGEERDVFISATSAKPKAGSRSTRLSHLARSTGIQMAQANLSLSKPSARESY